MFKEPLHNRTQLHGEKDLMEGMRLAALVLLMAITSWSGGSQHVATAQVAPIAAAPNAARANLVQNGDFEREAAGWSWMAVNGAQASGALNTMEKRSGRASYRLSNASAVAPHVYGRVYQTVNGLRPYTTYRISAWGKGKGVGIAWLGGGAGWGLRQRFPEGDFDWQQISTEYSTGATTGDFELMVLLESPTQALWIDDVEMVEVRADVEKRAQVEGEMQSLLQGEILHVKQVQEQLRLRPQLRNDRYIMMGVAIAERFLARVQRPAAELRQSDTWSRLQVEEVKEVLDSTQQRIAAIARGTLQIADVPQPAVGKVTIRNGVFYTDVVSRRGNRMVTQKNRPYYFGGYGHFGQAGLDLPNFPALGASLIQQDVGGPNFFLSPDGTPNKGAHALTDVLQVAARNRMKIDLLLSPHYFPDWAIKQAPELLNGNQGFIGYNIDHPKAREVVRNGIQAAARLVGNEPALFSFCLSNEPVYTSSGRDPYSRPLWVAYLRRRHGNSMMRLNALYGTNHKSFETVPVPALGMPTAVGAQRAYWDWVRFNQENFANWHGWMNGLAKAQAPGVPTHAKIMVFFTFDRNALHFGVDPELFCEVTDIAGCDAYAFPTGGDEVYSWLTQEMYYDLLHSFRNQPVFNSENHLIPDGSPPTHFSPEHTRAAFWQGGLHHQSATTMWVWEEGGPGGLDGSIYFRPANIYAADRAFLDLNRLSREVTAINQAKPRVALLYSMPSNFWEADYGGTLSRLYTMLNYSGQKGTFVSERQLQAGRYADVNWIIVPRATHVGDATVQALRAFMRRGGKVLLAGDNNLAWNEYHQPRTLPAEFQRAARLDLKAEGGEPAVAHVLRTILAQGGPPTVELQDTASGQPAWSVEYRIVPDGKRRLIPLINFSTKTQMVQLKLSGGKSQAIDLLSGETVDLNRITLASIEPRLLQVEPKS